MWSILLLEIFSFNEKVCNKYHIHNWVLPDIKQWQYIILLFCFLTLLKMGRWKIESLPTKIAVNCVIYHRGRRPCIYLFYLVILFWLFGNTIRSGELLLKKNSVYRIDQIKYRVEGKLTRTIKDTWSNIPFTKYLNTIVIDIVLHTSDWTCSCYGNHC